MRLNVDVSPSSERPTAIILVSRSRDLYWQLKEVLPDLPGATPSVRWGDLDHINQDADLYIWDYHPGLHIPIDLVSRKPHCHLFVLTRSSLPAFRESVPLPEVETLFGPVTSASLRASMVRVLVTHGGTTKTSRKQTIDLLQCDRDEILDCLLQANLKLQEFDQERTNFLTRAVHDFRAPLTAITGYCGLLLAEQLGEVNSSQREVLERMQRSTARLSRLASAMFQLSVGNRVSRAPLLRCCKIREHIDQAVHEMLPIAADKNVSVSMHVVAPTAPLLVDGSQMEQVLVNLLDNALKFTPKGGTVQVRAYPRFWDRRCTDSYHCREPERRARRHHSTNAYQLDVQDSGPGIPPGGLDGIFNEYTSYSGSQDRSGGGLGLAICKLIITQHHGRIWAANVHPTGAMFSCLLPMSTSEQGALPQSRLERVPQGAPVGQTDSYGNYSEQQ